MARKLKVFLAIFFAAITFFTGKIILDKTFAEDRNYGTATITFNSGTRSGNLTFSNGNATFSLKHGENIIIILQQGLTYAITQDSDGYSLSQTYNPGTLNDDVTSTFVDTLNGTTPSGIFIDLIPFIIFITFGICGLLLIRKFKYIN